MTNRQTISCNSFDGVFDTFPDKAFCILSHCDTEKKYFIEFDDRRYSIKI